ncbi:Extensin-like protein [Rhodopseudomonas palustris HaA2]|uniref:Extensin-like protein n=1 Tax=Rhodopseudomonas palustris (strain HaA2) TaxID=316058 RepID=Q2IYM4_RHOP2|nr:extensin family protein [Rhodopseudomonas palustris]ABD06686.1 Extensin-like protein [Rhodopseudomonas palustris HaA2]
MTRGVRLYLVGSFVLVSLAGCGRGLFQTAEREPWRTEAEVACLKSGAVKEGPELVRVDPISGPGVCGAEFPLKVAALGESGAIGFADDLRPPAAIGGRASQPRWPGAQPSYAAPARGYPQQQTGYGASNPPYGSNNAPVSLTAPGVGPAGRDIDLPDEGALPPADRPPAEHVTGYSRDPSYAPAPAGRAPDDARRPLPRLGPAQQGNITGSVGPVAIKPVATLACPIVSALDRWLVESVQPSAMRWFGVPVVEIKQISAYSCRGMNGNPNAHISEHAFGNALDISAFVLADGRRVTVKGGWKGLPEEQAFLHDVQNSACQMFNTVLAPGSNIYHYDHIHVDLMRRKSQRSICKPAAVPGEVIAQRLQGRNPYASGNWNGVTGSIGKVPARAKAVDRDEAEDD